MPSLLNGVMAYSGPHGARYLTRGGLVRYDCPADGIANPSRSFAADRGRAQRALKVAYGGVGSEGARPPLWQDRRFPNLNPQPRQGPRFFYCSRTIRQGMEVED